MVSPFLMLTSFGVIFISMMRYGGGRISLSSPRMIAISW